MKLVKLGVIIFVALGVGVAVLSTYKASVSGLMSQVGLVRSDFGAAVVQDKIRDSTQFIGEFSRCNLPARIKGAVTFLLSGDDKQGALAFNLGESRVACGAQMLAHGDAEAGTYEILKGFGYLTKGYAFVRERSSLDRTVCNTLPEKDITPTIQAVLDATNGRVYELLWSSWQDVLKIRSEVDVICLDQRNMRR